MRLGAATVTCCCTRNQTFKYRYFYKAIALRTSSLQRFSKSILKVGSKHRKGCTLAKTRNIMTALAELQALQEGVWTPRGALQQKCHWEINGSLFTNKHPCTAMALFTTLPMVSKLKVLNFFPNSDSFHNSGYSWVLKQKHFQKAPKVQQHKTLFSLDHSRALKTDPLLKQEYAIMDCKQAKENLKRKWALTVLSAESARKTAKKTTNGQVQEQGRAGKWKTSYQLTIDEGETVAARVIKYCDAKGKGWSKLCAIRGEKIYYCPVEFASDLNRKQFEIEEREDSLGKEALHLIYLPKDRLLGL
eukprot:6491872-Amphidinium_carterae.1